MHINSPYKSRDKSKRNEKLKVLESPIINNEKSTSKKKSLSVRKYFDRLFRRKEIEFESGFGEFKFNLVIFFSNKSSGKVYKYPSSLLTLDSYFIDYTTPKLISSIKYSFV